MSARSRPDGHWLDVAAAAVPAAAAAWSASLLAPLAGAPAGPASLAAGLLLFAGGWLVMRAAQAPQESYPLRLFRVPMETDELLLDCPAGDSDAAALLLDQPITGAMDALAELLLDDPLAEPPADSRVVRLFPVQRPACPQTLRRRVDLHVEARSGVAPSAAGDAADSLRQALDELRRTLHRQ